MQPHHYRFAVGSIFGLLIGAVIAGGLFWAYEYFWARFQPTVLTKDASQIQRMLSEGDWVSPGRTGRPVYMIAYRGCDACAAYEQNEFPKLAAANVDTRVLMFVRPDEAGESMSSPSERATVAELWINRSWDLYQSWMATSDVDWAPKGLRPADGDWARSAVVGATHVYVDKLVALLHENGLNGPDPILIWRDQKGRLKACSCVDRLSYHFVRSDFGAPANAPAEPAAAPSSAPAGSSLAPAGGQSAVDASAPAAAPQPTGAAQPASAAAPPAPTSSGAPAVEKPLANGPGSADARF